MFLVVDLFAGGVGVLVVVIDAVSAAVVDVVLANDAVVAVEAVTLVHIHSAIKKRVNNVLTKYRNANILLRLLLPL